MGIIQQILNTINTIWGLLRAIPDAIGALEDKVVGWINTIVTDIDDAYNYAYTLAEQDINYAVALFNSIVAWTATEYNNLLTWAAKEVDSIWVWIVEFYAAYGQDIEDIYSYIDGSINALLDYIWNNYIAPFLEELAFVYEWIVTNGAWVLNLLLHPELLAQLIAEYLLGAWIALGQRFALPFFRWFYASAISLIPDFTDVFEEIISSLFE